MMKQRFKSELIDQSGPHLALVSENGTVEPPTRLPFVTKTLGELGLCLPVGVPSNGLRVRPFRLRPFKMKQEKAVAKLRENFKGTGAGKLVCDIMATMIQTIGPHNFDNMKDGERQLAIGQLTMADVLYVYMYLRYEALGDDSPVVMQIRCVKCKNDYKWFGDLATMDIRVVPDEQVDLVRTYELRDPIQFRGKDTKRLRLGLINWNTFSRKEFQQAVSQQNSAIMASIVGFEGIDIPEGTLQIIDGDLDDMTKFDVAGLIADIEANTPGPQLDIEPECPECGYSAKMMLDWSWDNFFGRSGRLNPGNR